MGSYGKPAGMDLELEAGADAGAEKGNRYAVYLRKLCGGGPTIQAAAAALRESLSYAARTVSLP
jgi:hypothetical protein